MPPHSRAFLELVKVYLTCKACLLFYLSSCIFPLHSLGAKWVHFLTIGKAIVKKFKIGLIARYITIPVSYTHLTLPTTPYV